MIISNSICPVKVQDIARNLKISERTVRYDLDIIDDYLKSLGMPALDRRPKVGVTTHLSPDDKIHLAECINSMNTYNYIFTREERVRFIISDLLQNHDYTTINSLAEKLMISRSTVLKDLSLVKEWAAKHNIEFISAVKYGIKMCGSEKNIRRAAIELLRESMDLNRAINMQRNSPDKKNRVTIDNQFMKMIDDADISYIKTCLNMTEERLGILLSDEAYNALVIHIVIALKRIELGKNISMPYDELHSLEYTQEFTAAKELASMLEDRFKLIIPYDEIGYITMHLLGGASHTGGAEKMENWAEVDSLTGKLIEEVSCDLGINLNNDVSLFNGIKEHLKLAIYRLKHDLKIKNPIIDDIIKNYPSLFNSVKKCLHLIEKYAHAKIDDDETGYFVMHFGAAIERIKNQGLKKPNVLVVCSTGAGTSKILSDKLSSIFDLNITACIPSHKLESELLCNDIDLVITTIPLIKTDIKWIKVKPILDEKDIETLSRYLKMKDIKNTNIIFEEIMEAVKKSCKISDEAKLRYDLSRILDCNKYMSPNSKHPSLKELISQECIELNIPASTWQEAVYTGGSILLRNGCIEKRYIDEMIDTVNKMGPYIVISKGVAMPHARYNNGALKIGVSIITLKEPVCFGNKENDPVKIVISLSMVDNISHIKVLSEIVTLFQETEFYDICSCAAYKDDILNFIKEAKL